MAMLRFLNKENGKRVEVRLLILITLVILFGCNQKKDKFIGYLTEDISGSNVFYKLSKDSLFVDSLIIAYSNRDTLFQSWRAGVLEKEIFCINGEKLEVNVSSRTRPSLTKDYRKQPIDSFFISKAKVRMRVASSNTIMMEILNSPNDIYEYSTTAKITQTKDGAAILYAPKPGCFIISLKSKYFGVPSNLYSHYVDSFFVKPFVTFAKNKGCGSEGRLQ